MNYITLKLTPLELTRLISRMMEGKNQDLSDYPLMLKLWKAEKRLQSAPLEGPKGER